MTRKTERDTTALGVLALELASGSVPDRGALCPNQSSPLAERIARDLARWIPQIQSMTLSLAAAHFDPAEILRPGWPLHRRLEELQGLAPGSVHTPRLLAFGADAQGRIPQPFQADAQLTGGSLRVLPFVLSGQTQAVRAAAETMETVLLAQGMAQADTALLAQANFGARIEHARYLTIYDLAAMTSMQYSHQGLGPLWPLIETVLLAPQAEQWLQHPAEPVLRYADNEVRMVLFDPIGWRIHYGHGHSDCKRLDALYAQYLARQRQMAAVLEAHAVPVLYVHCQAGQDPKQALTG